MWGIWVDILFNLKQIGFLGSHVIWKNSGCVLESDRSQPSSPKPVFAEHGPGLLPPEQNWKTEQAYLRYRDCYNSC